MSDVIEKAVERLAKRLPDGFERTAKFTITGEGSIMVDATGVHAGDAPAEVTLIADTITFRAMLEGKTNPMTAFMTGKLKIDGPMPLAIKLGKAMA